MNKLDSTGHFLVNITGNISKILSETSKKQKEGAKRHFTCETCEYRVFPRPFIF